MENNGGAWCPKEEVSRASYEYIEIDLRQLHVITMVETQGRFGNGQVRKDFSWTWTCVMLYLRKQKLNIYYIF